MTSDKDRYQEDLVASATAVFARLGLATEIGNARYVPRGHHYKFKNYMETADLVAVMKQCWAENSAAGLVTSEPAELIDGEGRRVPAAPLMGPPPAADVAVVPAGDGGPGGGQGRARPAARSPGAWHLLEAVGTLPRGYRLGDDEVFAAEIDDHALIRIDGHVAAAIYVLEEDDPPAPEARTPLPPPREPPEQPHREDLRDRLGIGDDAADTGKGKPARKKDDATQETSDDLRTLWVTIDEHGERFKEWRSVCSEMSFTHFTEFDRYHDGPAAALDIFRNFSRHGGDPILWYQLWCREASVSPKERTGIEMRTLIECLHQCGSVDQLNGPTLICTETIARRVCQLIGAYSDGTGQPSWNDVRHFTTTHAAGNVVPVALRAWAHRKNKEDTETGTSRLYDDKRVAPTGTGATPVAGAKGDAAAKAKGGGKKGGHRRALIAGVPP